MKRRNVELILGTALFVLFMVSLEDKIACLALSIIITSTLPGLIALKAIEVDQKGAILIVPILSISISTWGVFLLSLLFGYSRDLILYFLLSILILYFISSPFPYKVDRNPQWRYGVIVSLSIFIFSFYVLYNSVWVRTCYGITIGGSNWQDTPMHYALIESMNFGNFPPKMPYFAIEAVHYHYFIDFYNSLLEKACGAFMPKLLPGINAYMIFLFSYSMYSLCSELFGASSGVISALIGTFGGGFQYYLMLSSIFSGTFSKYGDYIYQYGGLFGLPPIYDNLLQQRPLIVGLGMLLASIYLMFLGIKRKNWRYFVLAGIVSALSFPFHVFSLLISFLSFFLLLIIYRRKEILGFLAPLPIAAFPYFTIFRGATIQISGPLWAKEFLKDPWIFFFLNLGVPFISSILCVALKRNRKTFFLASLLFSLFSIPLVVSFTPNPWDMYKFYMFSWIPISALSGLVFSSLLKRGKAGPVLFSLLMISSCLDALPVLQYNLETHYLGLTYPEYEAGLWIRENTPEKAIFLTLDEIYSPVGMVGGRLRIIAYVNWPYGHGVPFSKVSKIARLAYEAYHSEKALKELIEEYNVSYIYLGPCEQKKYPAALYFFSSLPFLREVYSKGGVYIFKVEKRPEG